MYRIINVLLLLHAVLICGSAIHADESKTVNLGLDLDLRSHITSTNSPRAGLYQSTFHAGVKLNDGLHFNFALGQNDAYLINGGNKVNHEIVQEAALDKQWKSGERLQMGIVRLPFGLYDNREMYASGLIDYPLIRGDYALQSINWGVPGVRFGGGSSKIQGEAVVFGGQSSGIWNNLNNTRGVDGRVQLYRGNLILGLNHWSGSESSSLTASGEQATHLSGIDARYTLPHLLIRGEFMNGKLAGENVNGWYLDAFYHLPKYAKITLAARIEEFKPARDAAMSKQITFGARYNLTSEWIAAINIRRNNGNNYPGWTPASGKGGDLYFQLYRKLRF